MKKLQLFSLALGLFALTACGSTGGDTNDTTNHIGDTQPIATPEPAPNYPHPDDFYEWNAAWAVAQDFWAHFASGNTAGAFQMMTVEMQAALGAYMLEQTRNNILLTSGSFSQDPIQMVDTDYAGGAHSFSFMAINTTQFGIYRIVVSETGEIEGFWAVDSGFNPAADRTSDGFFAEPITIGAGSMWELDGVITMPDFASAEMQVPAVVLVHGSGRDAGDMDSSIFNNRPFLDIAEYLAQNGIAVIRYNKRTFTHANNLMIAYPDNLTVWQETVEDAVFAADILRADPRVDSNRIFMLGLSMGGMLSPRIHLSGGDFAGIILASSTPYSFTDGIIQQNLAVLETIEDATTREAFNTQLESVIELFTHLQDLTDEQARALPFDGGATFYYLRDMEAQSFMTLLPQVHVPFLVINGDRDFQTPADIVIPAFEEAFSGRDNVEIHQHPGINHILMPSMAENINDIFADYAIDGTVAPEILQQITAWIGGIR